MNPEQWLSLKWNGGSTMSDRWLNQSKIIHQLIFAIGTFQVSDLVYNTISGVIGGVIYKMSYKITSENLSSQGP